MNVWRLIAAGALALGLAACAGRQARTPPPAGSVPLQAAEQAQEQRAQQLAAQSEWSLAGRVAIQKAGKGGSGRIDWQQQGGAYTVALSAPVTRQSWRLDVAADGQARIDGLEGGARQGDDAERLLQEATGWEIPVAALADWARGLAAAGLPAAQLRFGADGRLAHIDQGGWRIDYPVWQSPAASGQAILPARIEARRGDAKVRLIIDAWNGADAP